jgi:hypothetical protein
MMFGTKKHVILLATRAVRMGSILVTLEEQAASLGKRSCIVCPICLGLTLEGMGGCKQRQRYLSYPKV